MIDVDLLRAVTAAVKRRCSCGLYCRWSCHDSSNPLLNLLHQLSCTETYGEAMWLRSMVIKDPTQVKLLEKCTLWYACQLLFLGLTGAWNSVLVLCSHFFFSLYNWYAIHFIVRLGFIFNWVSRYPVFYHHCHGNIWRSIRAKLYVSRDKSSEKYQNRLY